MRVEITLDECRSYATEANLRNALNKLGLDNYTSETRHGSHTCRYMVVRTPEGRWTAVFLASEHLNLCGGYALFAARHQFMSV